MQQYCKSNPAHRIWSSYSKYCPDCGGETEIVDSPAQTALCLNCHCYGEKGSKYCYICGKELKQIPAAAGI